jgi:hypothetical protein
MNVYDLADRLEELYIGTHIQKAAETLRYQADYIAQLEKGLESNIAMNKALTEREKNDRHDT